MAWQQHLLRYKVTKFLQQIKTIIIYQQKSCAKNHIFIYEKCLHSAFEPLKQARTCSNTFTYHKVNNSNGNDSVSINICPQTPMYQYQYFHRFTFLLQCWRYIHHETRTFCYIFTSHSYKLIYQHIISPSIVLQL